MMIPFGKDQSKELSFRLTPLGAAIVEALPDRAKVAKIKREFKKTGKCPPSVIFPNPTNIRQSE
jgi:hypothetical protein